jgi:hypothetical protein
MALFEIMFKIKKERQNVFGSVKIIFDFIPFITLNIFTPYCGVMKKTGG